MSRDLTPEGVLRVVSSQNHPAPQPIPHVRAYYLIVPTPTLSERAVKAWHVFRGIADDHIVDNPAKSILRFHPAPQLVRLLASAHGFPDMARKIREGHGEGFFLIEGRNSNDLRAVQFGYWPFPHFEVKGVGSRVSLPVYERRYKELAELCQELLDFRNGTLPKK